MGRVFRLWLWGVWRSLFEVGLVSVWFSVPLFAVKYGLDICGLFLLQKSKIFLLKRLWCIDSLDKIVCNGSFSQSPK